MLNFYLKGVHLINFYHEARHKISIELEDAYDRFRLISNLVFSTFLCGTENIVAH